jgi:hypothetical protein
MIHSFIEKFGAVPFVVFVTFYSVFWSYCFLNIYRTSFKNPRAKFIWFLVIVFIQIFGPILYLIFGKRSKQVLQEIEE